MALRGNWINSSEEESQSGAANRALALARAALSPPTISEAARFSSFEVRVVGKSGIADAGAAGIGKAGGVADTGTADAGGAFAAADTGAGAGVAVGGGADGAAGVGAVAEGALLVVACRKALVRIVSSFAQTDILNMALCASLKSSYVSSVLSSSMRSSSVSNSSASRTATSSSTAFRFMPALERSRVRGVPLAAAALSALSAIAWQADL